MLAPVRTVEPSGQLVTLADAKRHLRVEHDEDDAIIEIYLEGAIGRLDGWSGVLGRALETQTWRQDFPGFAGKLRLPLHPAASITAVTYFDRDNAEQTLAEDARILRTDALGPYVAAAIGSVFPETFERDDAVSVTYVAGQAPSEVPRGLRNAILMLVAHFYDRREATSAVALTEIPFSVSDMIAPFKRIGF